MTGPRKPPQHLLHIVVKSGIGTEHQALISTEIRGAALVSLVNKLHFGTAHATTSPIGQVFALPGLSIQLDLVSPGVNRMHPSVSRVRVQSRVGSSPNPTLTLISFALVWL